MTRKELIRCSWPQTPVELQYHDEEWGVPVRDDIKQFEFLTLEAFQSGLSWRLILSRRENFRKAFDGFDPAKVSRYGDGERERLLGDAGIVRNRAKIAATIVNAGAFCKLAAREGSFSDWIWRFVDGRPIVNDWRDGAVPALTPLSTQISAALKSEGFKFLGPTVVYSHMQATGMVIDHHPTCFRHGQLARVANRE